MNEKRVVQDIVSNDKRTIRNIPLNRVDRLGKPPVSPKIPEIKDYPKPKKTGSFGKSKLAGALITFIIVFVGVSIIALASSLFYLKAVVTIIPKTANLDINGTFTANKGAKSPDLAYTVFVASSSESQSVPASEGPEINTKATGSVYLVNEQKTVQKIVAGTRLSNTPGIIYRTTASVSIPSMKAVNGKDVPGTIEVKVVADKAGEEYNMTYNDNILRMLGFQGSSKYDIVYAKMKTDITGGFSGNKKIIAPDVMTAAVSSMKSSLKSNLQEKAKTLVPSGYISFGDAYDIVYDTVTPQTSDSSRANLSVKASIYVIAFNKDDLIRYIAKKDIDKFPSADYNIVGLDTLSFSIVNQKDFSAQKASPLIFMLKGQAKLVGKFSTDALKDELKGIKLENSSTVFAHYQAIGNASARLTPFWMRSFPNSVKDISIEIKD